MKCLNSFFLLLQDRSFTFILKNPPTSELLKKAAGIEKGSGLCAKEVIATITYQ